jgi:hypothetical protein
MPFSEMLSRVALVGTDISEELSASIIRVTRIGELETTLAVTSIRCTFALRITFLFHRFYPDDGGPTFLRNVGSYKSHTE